MHPNPKCNLHFKLVITECNNIHSRKANPYCKITLHSGMTNLKHKLYYELDFLEG